LHAANLDAAFGGLAINVVAVAPANGEQQEFATVEAQAMPPASLARSIVTVRGPKEPTANELSGSVRISMLV